MDMILPGAIESVFELQTPNLLRHGDANKGSWLQRSGRLASPASPFRILPQKLIEIWVPHSSSSRNLHVANTYTPNCGEVFWGGSLHYFCYWPVAPRGGCVIMIMARIFSSMVFKLPN